MPVTVGPDYSGYILWNAWANDADKEAQLGAPNPGAGDGLKAATAFDTIDAGLASFTGIEKTDVNVTNLYPHPDPQSAWTIEFVGTLALTDILDISIDSVTFSPPLIDLTINQQGTYSQNEIYQITLFTTALGPDQAFRLRRLNLTGQRIEERIAQRWIESVIRADTVMNILTGNLIYTGRIPSSVKLGVLRPSLCTLIEHQSNTDIITIGGRRHFAGHLISVCAMAPQDSVNDHTDFAAQRLSELFQDEQNITLADGTMLRCVRVGQVDSPDPDSTDQQWQKLGVLLDISIQQA